MIEEICTRMKPIESNVADIYDLVGARILPLRSGDALLVERVIQQTIRHAKQSSASQNRCSLIARKNPCQALPAEQDKDPISEIQVRCIVMWTWATLNHDIE